MRWCFKTHTHIHKHTHAISDMHTSIFPSLFACSAAHTRHKGQGTSSNAEWTKSHTLFSIWHRLRSYTGWLSCARTLNNHSSFIGHTAQILNCDCTSFCSSLLTRCLSRCEWLRWRLRCCLPLLESQNMPARVLKSDVIQKKTQKKFRVSDQWNTSESHHYLDHGLKCKVKPGDYF